MKKVSYQPISCAYYDQLILYIMRKQMVDLVYFDEDEQSHHIRTILLDVYTREGAEYLRFGKSQEVRLDKIISVNGENISYSC